MEMGKCKQVIFLCKTLSDFAYLKKPLVSMSVFWSSLKDIFSINYIEDFLFCVSCLADGYRFKLTVLMIGTPPTENTAPCT